MNLVPISDFDVVFISYDEPNAEKNYQDLLEKCPWAVRSHGVLGSDACHKAAAALSETSRFITVDADNIVDADFFDIEIDMDRIGDNDVISWAGRNVVNGLVYGNGGIKMWPVHVVEQMQTHEAAPENDTASQVDFCWNINYFQMNNCYSRVENNASPYQAYRAGFREGCKMSLAAGDTVMRHNLKKVHQKNLQRMLVWLNVGADAENGIWAIYGARLGCAMTNLWKDEWDWRDVRDFEWHTRYWNETIAPKFESNDDDPASTVLCPNSGYQYNPRLLREETQRLGSILREELDLNVVELDANTSKLFKETYNNPARLDPMVREDQVTDTVE